ncbi:MAG TPA: hypothetical protein DCL61_02255, partial [Cyanobacteria bacterium UBA12227]|nr:hypothetical protein [Cyanobacteria bacterium UBA12227]
WEKAILTGSLGAYLLEQIGAEDWRQSAGLLMIMQGQMGVEVFRGMLAGLRGKIIPLIGVDGYDYIPQLLVKYRELME